MVPPPLEFKIYYVTLDFSLKYSEPQFPLLLNEAISQGCNGTILVNIWNSILKIVKISYKY